MPTATELPIDSGATAMQMAMEIFGNGITVNSASYSGDALSSGIYTNGDTVSPDATPGDSGVILSTGHVDDFTNSDGTTNTNQSGSTSTNTSGVNNDGDFNTLAGAATRDAAFMEIDFTPTGDTITIDFVLSSEEYPEYINSAFNDVVGVWVNGVQAQVTIGDGSASIGNINGGATQNIYHDNTGDAYNTEMDGFTVTLTFVAPVNSGVVNTLKIGVADVADSSYDTNLLIAGGSVQSTIVARDDQVSLGNNDTKTVDVLGNDSSTGGTLTVTHINGTAVVAGDTVALATGQSITLNADGTFEISGDGDAETVYFNYSIEDQVGNTDTALVEVTQVPCFVAGTMIETPNGPHFVEMLRPGMKVCVRDGRPEPLRWIGMRKVRADGRNRPVRLPRGMLDAQQDLLVSQQHRFLIAGPWAELLFGEPEVLVKARDLVPHGIATIERDCHEVTFVHLLFDRHEIVTANGVATESYLPGPATMAGFDAGTQAELFRLFPELEDDADGYGAASRPILSSREARALLAVA